MSESNNTAVVVPTIGESITSAFIAQWFKKVGEYVQEGESLLEVDSDKASLEVPSPVSGVVTELLAEDGDEVPSGATIARIDTQLRRGPAAAEARLPQGAQAPTRPHGLPHRPVRVPRRVPPLGRRQQSTASISARSPAQAFVVACWHETSKRLPRHQLRCQP